MVTSDGTESIAELDLLRAQRALLASRLKTRWWYVAAMAFGWAVAFAMPIGSRYLTGASLVGSLLVIVVWVLAQRALARVSGVDLGLGTRRYPSARPWTFAVVGIIFAGDAAESLLLAHGLLAAAIAVGVLAAVAGTACWQGHLRAVRRDLEAGRAVT